MQNFRNRYLLLADLSLLAVLPALVYAIRFESWDWGADHRRAALLFTAASVPISVGVFYLHGLYRRLWQYASVADLQAILAGTFTAVALNSVVGLLLRIGGLVANRVPLSVLFIHGVLLVCSVAGARLLVRIGVFPIALERRKGPRGEPVLIAGAGTAGQLFLRELRANPRLGMAPVGFVDDDPTKFGHWMANVQVLGTVADIPSIVAKRPVSAVVIAMPSAPGSVVRQIVRIVSEAGIGVRTVPSLSEILSGRLKVASLRDVQIEDLLRREPIQTDLDQVRNLCAGKTVLITGAGGSIGSELCRQVAALDPARLILLGHGENSIFQIQGELGHAFPELTTIPVIADIRDRKRIWSTFSDIRPQVVFHAAAHKHVPLMEENVIEAVTNNVVGTRNVAEAAAALDVETFVLVSTDKAVRPRNVMGATKRAAEHVVYRVARTTKRPFVAVRFGNVLGSRGSVVPTFLQQIRAGGPVRVTHPEMRRFFMTIPEAVQLVLQAGALGKGADLFMLDMGEPVRILDLARDMIRLCGLEVDQDIKVVFSGVRPGEKLYEEMFWGDEMAVPTEHPKILRTRQNQAAEKPDCLLDQLMLEAEGNASAAKLRSLLRKIVPDFEGAMISLPAEAQSPALESSDDPLPVPRASGMVGSAERSRS
jgi:FlaA1/EpsC-like NDP-sugar epimerase